MRVPSLLILLTLASSVAAQPTLQWERVGTQANDSELAYSIGPDGDLLFGGVGPPTEDGEYLEGTWHLHRPAGSEQAWERIGPRPRSGYLWAFALGRDTLLAQAHNGLYRSTDGGRTWEHRADSPTLTAWQILEIPVGPYAGRIVVTTDANKASFSDDRGGYLAPRSGAK